MKRQRNTTQMKEQIRNMEVQINEEEIGKLPENEFRIMVRWDQISRSVVSDSLWPHESQHARPPCPSPTPGVHSDSRPSSQWCHPAISYSVVPFSSCPQSLPNGSKDDKINLENKMEKMQESINKDLEELKINIQRQATQLLKLKILWKESIAEYLKQKNESVSWKIKWWK